MPEARPLPQASVPQSSSFEETLLHCPSEPRPWCGGEVALSLRNGSVASSPDLASRQGRAGGLQECPGLSPDRTHVGHGGPAGGRGALCSCPALLPLGVCAPRRGTGAAGPMSRPTAGAEEGPRLHPCRPSSSWTFRASVCPAWSQVAALAGQGPGHQPVSFLPQPRAESVPYRGEGGDGRGPSPQLHAGHPALRS